MKYILKVGNDWYVRTDANNRLHNLLAPAYVIVEGRNEAYGRRVKNEYKGYQTGAVEQLLDVRKKSIENLKGNMNDNA
jgi:hypothetical protein